MKNEKTLYKKEGGVAFITLNRPEARNAIDSAMRAELADRLEAVEQDDEVRAVIITGAGEAFSVGDDVQELAAELDAGEERLGVLEARWSLEVADPWSMLASLSKPTFAAINGIAEGSGLELALACDIRYASSTATFGFPEVKLGIIPSHGGTQRLPRTIGRAKALEMLLTGATIDAEEAARVELVSKVCDPTALLEEAEDLATLVSAYGPVAMRIAREAVGRGMDMSFDQGLRLEMDLYALIQTTEDRMEGLRAFRERRKPRFSGK